MPDPAKIPERISVLESLGHEHYSSEELAELLGISPTVIREAVRRGELKGFIVDHRVIDIRRTDAIAWLKRRMQEANKPLRGA